MAVQLGKSRAVVCQWRTHNRLPKNPEIRAKYLKLERLIAGPGLRLKRQAQAKQKAKKIAHAK